MSDEYGRYSQGVHLLSSTDSTEKGWDDEAESFTGRSSRSGSKSRFMQLKSRPSFGTWLLFGTLVVSLACNAWLLWEKYSQPIKPTQSFKSITGLAERPFVTRKEGFYAPEYDPSIANESDIEALWKQADSGFGLIALDTQWAAEKDLEPSRAWKLDRSKSVYVFTAYHALHCTRSLRLVFKKVMNGEPMPDFWKSHGLHCFEIIREELMCSATDAVYATKLDDTRKGILRIGAGETRQCTDWEYLRDWAGQRTAGYTPGEDDRTEPHPEFVEGGATTDGWYIPPALTVQ